MSGGAQTHLDNHLVEGSHYARSRTRYGHWVSIKSPPQHDNMGAPSVSRHDPSFSLEKLDQAKGR